MKVISKALHRKLYNTEQPHREKASTLVKRFGLENTPDNSSDTELSLPNWVTTASDTLDRAASYVARDVLSALKAVTNWDNVQIPQNFPVTSGWYKIDALGAIERCEAPSNKTLVIDTEAVPIDGVTTPICFCGFDGQSWYIWLNTFVDLVPLVPDGTGNLYIAHNANFDRALLRSSYSIGAATNKYYCTMSAVTSVRGMSNQQLIMYNASQSFDFQGWESEATKAGLSHALKFYTDEELDKSTRGDIWTVGVSLWVSETAEILRYCCLDVASTVTLAGYVIPEQFVTLPSLVTLAGQVLVGQEKLFLTHDWDSFYPEVETVFGEALSTISETLCALIPQTKPNCFNSFLEWDTDKKGQVIWQKKARSKAKKAGVKGYSVNWRECIAMLCLTYRKHPIVWDDGCWNYAPEVELEPADGGNYKLTMHGEETIITRDDFDFDLKVLYPLPHPEKRGGRLVKLIIKSTVEWFDNEIVSLAGETKPVIDALVSITNWESLRARVRDVEYKKVTDSDGQTHILHIPASDVNYGTISRRKGSKLWLVAPNPKKNKIGTEIKSYVTAPGENYKLVTCDFDSQEAVVFALLGDSKHGVAGYTPISISVNLGDKDTGTDIHSMQAKATGINRATAKELVYASFYGQGVKNAAGVILKGNSHISDTEATTLARKFHDNLKGTKTYGAQLTGGMASDSYNVIDSISDSLNPRTPFLNCRIPLSLNTTEFATTRKNWVVQSSGRDLLDSFITLITYGIHCEQLDAYLSYTCHDEVIFICAESDTSALAEIVLHSHLLTYANFVDALGLDSLMQCRKYPELVDVDTVWRKSVDDKCVTPTNTRKFRAGSSYTVSDFE
jgi:hypothetical protein